MAIKTAGQEGVFVIPARRCARCGGLLTSEYGLQNGYGVCCMRKRRQEEAERLEQRNQMNLFDGEMKGEETPLSGGG